ncbi:MAG: succinate dehydrogenase iron-sulfur subunit [Phycisphaerales bacterium]|nr:succinate dehydrogenase iron-sulfur subunit [Phycisphaerales bacterium]
MTQPSTSERTIAVRILRRDNPDQKPRWEEFSIPWRPNLNIIACLQYIAAHPVTSDGQKTTQIVYDSNCLEEVCGACTMLINGQTRQACSALVDKLEQPITLEPMTKFPLVRDLFVDRQRLFDDMKRIKAWVPIDGTYDLGPGPTMSQKVQQERYWLSRCISCGCCLEACPQYTTTNHFTGAMIFTMVKLFNLHPTGAALKNDRLDEMMNEGGISDCSKAGNCVEVCPKEIPNLESIATVGRQTTVHSIKKFFNG